MSGQNWSLNGKGQGFIANGKLFLQRCPSCERENYAPAVASGTCAWCGWKPKTKATFVEFEGERIALTSNLEGR